jgi:hypothetical protein
MDHRSPRQRYTDWVQDRIEEYKSDLTRDELLALADRAVHALFDTDDAQYPLTEILLRDAVDALIFRTLDLPGYRKWLKTCHTDTPTRPQNRTNGEAADEELLA